MREENIRKLHSFIELPENWNDNGAKPVSLTLVNKCIEFINSPNLNYQPDIFPTARDSVQFEYEKPNGSYLEIEIYENHISYLYIDETGKEIEQEFANWSEALDLIYEFHTAKRNS